MKDKTTNDELKNIMKFFPQLCGKNTKNDYSDEFIRKFNDIENQLKKMKGEKNNDISEFINFQLEQQLGKKKFDILNENLKKNNIQKESIKIKECLYKLVKCDITKNYIVNLNNEDLISLTNILSSTTLWVNDLSDEQKKQLLKQKINYSTNKNKSLADKCSDFLSYNMGLDITSLENIKQSLIKKTGLNNKNDNNKLLNDDELITNISIYSSPKTLLWTFLSLASLGISGLASIAFPAILIVTQVFQIRNIMMHNLDKEGTVYNPIDTKKEIVDTQKENKATNRSHVERLSYERTNNLDRSI